jgi:hypothetical protein
VSRAWQIFVAPGPEEEPLPIAASPWHQDRWVHLPKEHWGVIVDFAASIDPTAAEWLDEISTSSDPEHDHYVRLSAQDAERLLAFLRRLGEAIETAEPLVPKATDEVPDEFVNDEHVRMLEAVSAVIAEATRRGEPFRAWKE